MIESAEMCMHVQAKAYQIWWDKSMILECVIQINTINQNLYDTRLIFQRLSNNMNVISPN